jgi:protein-L-isoaspartate(D-aspartate) O-methyltransferase
VPAWPSVGPGTAGLHVSAYPRDTDLGAIAEPGSVIDKRYNRLALTWTS